MRKHDHYLNCIDKEYILNAEYDERGDRFTMEIKKLSGENYQRIQLPDVVVKSILALYQQLKFQVDTLKEDSVYDKLDNMRNELSEIRDNQKEIKGDPDGCICQQFDLIIDELESLRDKFGRD